MSAANSRACCGARAALALLFIALASCGGGEGAPPVGVAPGPAPSPVPAPPTTPLPTPQGFPVGAAVTATIDDRGGTLTSADGRLDITIPAGALGAPTVISIEPITNFAHGGFGPAYRLSPEGLGFALPVQLVFGYGADDLLGTAVAALGVSFQDAQGYWRALKNVTRDEQGRTLSVTTTHFSDWSRVTGVQLRPPRKTLRSSESLDLVVSYCEFVEDNSGSGDPLTMLQARCDSGGPIVWPVKDWSVDAIVGGDFAVGVVTPDARGDGARYQPPIVLNGSETHAVSVEVNLPGASKTLLVANITTADYPATWTGSSSGTLASGDRYRATVTWHDPALDSDGRIRYRFKGSVFAEVAPGPGGCTITPSSSDDVDIRWGVSYLAIDYAKSPPAFEVAGTTAWPVTVTCVTPPSSGSGNVEAVWLSGYALDRAPAYGELSADGRRIAGQAASPAGSWNWQFDAQ